MQKFAQVPEIFLPSADLYVQLDLCFRRFAFSPFFLPTYLSSKSPVSAHHRNNRPSLKCLVFSGGTGVSGANIATTFPIFHFIWYFRLMPGLVSRTSLNRYFQLFVSSMMRKGRNNVDQNASKHNYSESGSNNTSSSDIRENDQSKLGGVFKKEDIPSTTFHGKSLSSNGKKSKKTKSSANRKQNNEKEREHGSHKKSDADNFHLSSDSKTPIEKSSSGTDGSAENLRDTTHRFFDVLMGKNIGGSSLNVLKAFNVWVEKQKTQINTLTTVIHDSHDYVCVRIKIVYPILSAWILHIGKIMLLLSVLWLDCNFRGLNSLIHLGTTSFITVIWCSIFSLLAMIGITKMLIIMGFKSSKLAGTGVTGDVVARKGRAHQRRTEKLGAQTLEWLDMGNKLLISS